ncbi:methyltransferase domain-containing protein [Candidatus Poribacteria bacterium]|nr:methyltransferase domain-containing protein [Candidatus Poribacteria bacterium]
MNLAQEQGHFVLAFYIDLKAAEGIDLLADATRLPFKPESVDEFVANNPYGYGFNSLEDGVEFLSGIRTVLKPSGRLVIRAHSKNPYAEENRIKQAASQLGLVSEVREIEAETAFPGHIFRTTYGRRTVPNLEFVISKMEFSGGGLSKGET